MWDWLVEPHIREAVPGASIVLIDRAAGSLAWIAHPCNMFLVKKVRECPLRQTWARVAVFTVKLLLVTCRVEEAGEGESPVPVIPVGVRSIYHRVSTEHSTYQVKYLQSAVPAQASWQD